MTSLRKKCKVSLIKNRVSAVLKKAVITAFFYSLNLWGNLQIIHKTGKVTNTSNLYPRWQINNEKANYTFGTSAKLCI